jgi:transposase
MLMVRRKLKRSDVIGFFRSLPRCLVGIEACATAHYWAREVIKRGHEVKLMPPAYVKAYVKRNKNDAADAEAICEAVTRPSMRFVPVKDAEQQSVLVLHRVRNLLVRQHTMLVNALRAHMAEFGIIAPQGLRHVADLTKMIAHQGERLPTLARPILQIVVDRLDETSRRLREIEARLAKSGIGRARSANCWRRCLVSALWVPAPSLPPSRTHLCSSQAASSPLGWA